jgi:hypothetical protein
MHLTIKEKIICLLISNIFFFLIIFCLENIIGFQKPVWLSFIYGGLMAASLICFQAYPVKNFLSFVYVGFRTAILRDLYLYIKNKT